jgi:hypothetical protein
MHDREGLVEIINEVAWEEHWITDIWGVCILTALPRTKNPLDILQSEMAFAETLVDFCRLAFPVCDFHIHPLTAKHHFGTNQNVY